MRISAIFSTLSIVALAVKRWAFTGLCALYGVALLAFATTSEFLSLLPGGLTYVSGIVLLGAVMAAIVGRNPVYALFGAAWLVWLVCLAAVVETASPNNVTFSGWLYVAASVVLGVVALVLHCDYRHHRHLGII